MNKSTDTNVLSLGRFRDEISRVKAPYLTRDNPLEPLSISMPVDHIHVVLGASPYISLRSGTVSVTLSHIQTIKRSIKGGVKGYRIVCGDYTASIEPRPVEYHIYYDKKGELHNG